jgi:hypothetical protein
MYENEILLGIHRLLLAFYGEGTVDVSAVHCRVRKWRDNSGYLDLERPAVFWKACQHNSEAYYHNSRFEQAKSRQTY